MKRRQLLAGIGALAAGGSAALGTGAFTAASADRDVSVTVAGDASAYVALESQSEYAIQTANGLKLDFSQTVSGGGSGVGEDSFYQIGKDSDGSDAIFTLTNQGTQEVEITPQFEEQFFDSDGNLIANNKSTDTSQYGAGNPPENAELAIALYNKYYEGPRELSPGQTEGYFAYVATGSDPPESLTTEFSINADAT